MKKFLVIFLSVIMVSPAWADLTTRNTKNLPEGVFKKTRNGNIVQIDKNGKKIGVYKVVNGKFVKIK